ncbi:uncharacterized protein LOC107014765 isoform X2 [Solanum pennellii]|uniref:Uncharacterized protein LOC107014765 isoform X2 n=1 Tax=Solanum pennellii TaxID=28526 RepID=A0ABM1GFB7_SOLPN|nr:uncharacterized protein LOC107014765 isoform X2 [Solanum pennellii]
MHFIVLSLVLNDSPLVESLRLETTHYASKGKENLKHGDEKETDGGDVSYSASQDHQFNGNEGTREKQLEIPHSESSIDNNKSNALEKRSNEVNKVAMVEGGIVQVERELKLEDESMRNNINIERVEPAKFPREGGLRKRSSSSSKPSMSEDIVQVATTASDIDNEAFGSSEKENEKRELGVMDEKTRTLNVVEKTGLEKRDYEAVATSNAKPFKAVKDDDKLEISYNVPVVDAGVRANNMEGSTHEHQPLVALDPRPVQTTSWKSCCGLFEVFAGSNK